jgi:hypothetical protein
MTVEPRWLLLASAVVGIGLVAALHRLAPAEHRTLADWTAAVGLLGFVTLAVHQVRLMVTAVVLLPGSPPRGLRLLAALAATMFLTLPMSEEPWAVLVASVAASTTLPGGPGGLAVHPHRMPADSRG